MLLIYSKNFDVFLDLFQCLFQWSSFFLSSSPLVQFVMLSRAIPANQIAIKGGKPSHISPLRANTKRYPNKVSNCKSLHIAHNIIRVNSKLETTGRSIRTNFVLNFERILSVAQDESQSNSLKIQNKIGSDRSAGCFLF